MNAIKINPPVMMRVIELFAQGYTVRTVREKLETELEVKITDQQLLQIAINAEADIKEVRDIIAADTMKRGLSRKEERVRRLSEVAEAVEDAAMTGNLKAASTYSRILGQIREETEPLGLTVITDREDPWFQLLKKVRTQPPAQLPDSTQP